VLGGWLGPMDLIPSSSDPMPDPSTPPLITFSTPRTPQPYQERFLAALEDGSRLETWQERWNRQRNESRENFAASIKRIQEAFARRLIDAIEVERGPTIGRKRRARRARGRRRGNA
jgi:hypothetical protein